MKERVTKDAVRDKETPQDNTSVWRIGKMSTGINDFLKL